MTIIAVYGGGYNTNDSHECHKTHENISRHAYFPYFGCRESHKVYSRESCATFPHHVTPVSLLVSSHQISSFLP
jgi:hypothetical protein